MSAETKPENPSAFPESMTELTSTRSGETYPNTYSYGGMSLRDYFAAKAMRVILEKTWDDGTVSRGHVAEWAYAHADAMLKAREAK